MRVSFPQSSAQVRRLGDALGESLLKAHLTPPESAQQDKSEPSASPASIKRQNL